MNVLRRGKNDERGVAMVEFALIIPVLLLVVAGLLEFGRAFTYWLNANHLANEGARWAVVDRVPAGANIQAFIYCQAATKDMQNGISILGNYPGESRASAEVGDQVKVVVKRDFDFLPIVDIATVTITGTSTMRLERIANNVDPLLDPTNDITPLSTAPTC